ncbi:MAG TPA: hypothetical protein VFX30_04090 [bacterium]|nr:hypothetical protein [bacterium]
MRATKPILYVCLSITVLCASTALAETGVKPFAIDAPLNVGDSLTLQSDVPDHFAAGWFQKLNLGEKTGAADYQENISGSSSRTLSVGDVVSQKNGNMVGPTNKGVKDLIAQDPDAYWDQTNACVVTSNPASPRIAPLVVFDPEEYLETGVVRIAAFQQVFFEAILGGSQVVVRATSKDPARTCLVNEQKETTCNDGRDNDGDGAVDCQDSDCSAVIGCTSDINVSAIPPSATVARGQQFVRVTGVINPFNSASAVVTVVDRIPQGSNVVSIASVDLYLQGSTEPVRGACSVDQTESQTDIVCTSPLQEGTRMDIVVVETISSAGIYEHGITASSDRIDPNPADNVAVFTAIVE